MPGAAGEGARLALAEDGDIVLGPLRVGHAGAPPSAHLAVGVRQNQMLLEVIVTVGGAAFSVSSALPLQAAGTDGTEPNQEARSPCSFGEIECSSHW